MKKTLAHVLSLLCVIVSIILMALPISVEMVLAPGPDKRVIETSSYFGPIVFGYGNWFPIITAIMSIIVVLSIVWNLFGNKGSKVTLVCSTISAVSSVLAMVLFTSISVVSIIIAVLLCISTALQWIQYRAK